MALVLRSRLALIHRVQNHTDDRGNNRTTHATTDELSRDRR